MAFVNSVVGTETGSARLYPFEIGALLGRAWIADRLSNFFEYPAFDRHQEKSGKNLTCYNHH